jgi:hypothetical protein
MSGAREDRAVEERRRRRSRRGSGAVGRARKKTAGSSRLQQGKV